MYVLVLVLTVLIIFSFRTIRVEQLNNERLNSELYFLSDDIFKHYYSVKLFEYGQILRMSSEVATEEDLMYINGRIDGYLADDIFLFSRLNSIEKDLLNKILLPELQQPILILFNDISGYLRSLQQSALHSKDLDKYIQKSKEFEELYLLERRINSYNINDLEHQEKILNDISGMKRIMHGD